VNLKRTPLLFVLACVLVLGACRKDNTPYTLTTYLGENPEFTFSSDLIACAGGMPEGWMGDAEHPTSVFFLPYEGAHEFKYWETDQLIDNIGDYAKFEAKELEDAAVFNGKLWRFKNTAFEGERWGIVTYKTEGTMHVCEAIRLKTNVKPTQDAPILIDITENGTTPHFTWEDGLIEENVIYFQVVRETDNDVISATYTYDKFWTFYDLSNVVLNVHDVTPAPTLQPSEDYLFLLMGVSEDNWVNLVGEKQFSTQ